MLTETYDFLTKLTKWVTKPVPADETTHAPDKVGVTMQDKPPVRIDWYDVMSLHWMARRYADGRSSYSPGLFNGITRKLLGAGVELKSPHFARDGMGRRYDGLTDEQVAEAAEDMPRGFVPEADQRLVDALELLHQAECLLEKIQNIPEIKFENYRLKLLTHIRAFQPFGPQRCLSDPRFE